MLSQFQYVFWGLLFAAVLIFGWEANGWRIKAQEAAKLQAMLAKQQGIARKAELDRLELALKLKAQHTDIHAVIREVVKRVPTYIDRDNCVLSVDGVRALNDARGVPRSANGAAVASGPADKNPGDDLDVNARPDLVIPIGPPAPPHD